MVAHYVHGNTIIYDPITIISVFKVDLECGLALEVSTAPPTMGKMDFIHRATGHGDCIYIGGRFPFDESILFNVMTQEWRWMNSPIDKLSTSFGNASVDGWLWTSNATYHPGLNPFLKV